MAIPSSFLSPNFPILAIIISGILTTTLILLSFYFFITKCHLRNTSVQNSAPVMPIFPTKPQGLKPSIIRAIPITKFSKGSISTILCTICLNEFHVEEKLRLLPNCSHAFHIDCIDTWLQSNTNCPLCRVYITNPILHLKQNHGIIMSSDNEREEEEEQREENYFMRREDIKDKKWSLLGDDCIVHVRENEEEEQREENYFMRREDIKDKKWSLLGDDCIVHVRENEEELHVQPLRRSLSMDSSNERQIYLSVQEMLKKRQNYQSEVEDGAECSTRSVQTCFSFSQSRSWQKQVRIVG